MDRTQTTSEQQWIVDIMYAPRDVNVDADGDSDADIDPDYMVAGSMRWSAAVPGLP